MFHSQYGSLIFGTLRIAEVVADLHAGAEALGGPRDHGQSGAAELTPKPALAGSMGLVLPDWSKLP